MSPNETNKAKIKEPAVEGFLSIIFYRKISRIITPLFLSTPLTANQITFISGIVGVAAAVFISFGGYWSEILGLVVMHFGRVLDHVDGEVARAKNMTSVWGANLDFILDRVVESALIISCSVGVFRDTHDVNSLIWGSLAVGGYLFFFYLTNVWIFPLYKLREREQALNTLEIMGKKMTFLVEQVLATVFTFAIIFQQIKIALILCALFSAPASIVQVVRIYRISVESEK